MYGNLTNKYTTLHHTTLHSTPLHYTTLHYTTLHYTTLHYTTLHYTTLHYTKSHYTTLHCTPHLVLQHARTYRETSHTVDTITGHVQGFQHFVVLQCVAQRHACVSSVV